MNHHRRNLEVRPRGQLPQAPLLRCDRAGLQGGNDYLPPILFWRPFFFTQQKNKIVMKKDIQVLTLPWTPKSLAPLLLGKKFAPQLKNWNDASVNHHKKIWISNILKIIFFSSIGTYNNKIWKSWFESQNRRYERGNIF